MNTPATKPSPRKQVVERIVDSLKEMGLDEVYGVNVAEPQPGVARSYYQISFCKARITDGSVRVWGRSSISVRWQTAIRDLPRNGQVYCKSPEEAIEVIRERFHYPLQRLENNNG